MIWLNVLKISCLIKINHEKQFALGMVAIARKVKKYGFLAMEVATIEATEMLRKPIFLLRTKANSP